MASVISQLYTFIKEGKNEKAISTIKNIEPDSLFHYDRFLLHRAVEYDNVVMAEYLIDNGWDLNATNVHGKCLLEIALKRGKADMMFMVHSRRLDLIRRKNAIIDQRIKLTKPRWPNDLELIKNLLYNMTSECFDNKEIAEKLLELNCPLAAVVCVFWDAQLTKLMLDRGCLVDGRLVSTGETALHLAVEYRDVKNARLLLGHGAKVDATDDIGSTPISRLNIDDPNGNVEILKLLLGYGASLTVTFSRRRSSRWDSHSHGPRRTVMDKILQKGDMRMLRLVIPYIDLCHKDTDGCTPLHHLVNSGNQYSLEILRGKSVDANAPDNNGWTPRDIAVSRGMYEKVSFLLEHGASPNNFDHDGDVALRHLLYGVISSKEAKNVFELLLLYNVNLELLTRSDSTNFALSCAMEDLEFAKPVLAHLAKLESLSVSLNTFFVKEIKSKKDIQNYFNSCKRQIEEMKTTTLYQSITLYKMLIENQKRLTIYARNEDFRLHYESFKNKEYSIHSYYVKSITLRVDEAIALAKMKNKVACIICRITGLPTSMVDIAYTIVDYLNRSDFENIIGI